MRLTTLALLLVFVIPAWASEPGQPLDCTDVTFVEPGLTCTEYDVSDSNFDLPWVGSNVVVDNAGRLLRVTEYPANIWNPSDLLAWKSPMNGLAVRALSSQGGVLLYIADRTGLGGYCDHVRPSRPQCRRDSWQDCILWGLGRTVLFEPSQGRLMIPATAYCHPCGGGSEGCPYYGDQKKILVIEGLGGLYDIQQTYDPASGLIGFLLPGVPEGLPFAESFDTYYGDLATVGDWSQAQPLLCGFPATAPSTGDYLTVEDTLPAPAPRHGYYYVTAVNYQGQRRYGRQSNGGVLSARDSAVLPECGGPN